MTSSQRLPAKERMVADIGAGDVRVSVVGTVVSSDGGLISVDDGTGRIDASFEEAQEMAPGKPVRVMGKLVPLDGGFEIQGEALQDFTGADVKLWRKVSGLWEESLSTL